MQGKNASVLKHMSNYTVSARKYRPVTFESVVGQQALTTTLKNAIASGKLANAYLFCGPRGVGKTTCARLFAKTINCEHPGPDGEACGECASCQTFNEDMRSYNVFELDAASNNSVDDIRALTEQVRIPPVNGKYKVYIIDEVHMLSTQAFNAFLKTLEEPPAYAIFILATTEKHKVIPTILSRCQTYDFSRITTQDIVDHLRNVAAKEGVEVQDEALAVIAEKADGGMRDALSIFDQVVSFTQGHVTYARTIENLNVLDFENYFKMTGLLLETKISESLLLLNDILCKGFDAGHFISGLLLHFRNLLVSRDACTLPLLEVSDAMRVRYQEQAQKCQPKFLYKAMKLCTDCDLNYRVSKNRRLLVELTLIRVAQAASPDGDDDDSSGRSPKKVLKAIFSTENVRNAAGEPGKTAAVTKAVNSATQARIATPQPVPKSEPKSVRAQTVDTSKAPTVKMSSLFTSIRSHTAQSGNAANQQKSAFETARVDSNRQVQPLTAERLSYCWKEFATKLPPEETPLMNRMLTAEPKMLSDTQFSITAVNDMAAQDYRDQADTITAYMRTQFNNPAISMQINVDTSVTNARILSNAEKLDLMCKNSPELAQLVKELSLELD